jgi:hypothetical protein
MINSSDEEVMNDLLLLQAGRNLEQGVLGHGHPPITKGGIKVRQLEI